jgi:hypothetical protein
MSVKLRNLHWHQLFPDNVLKLCQIYLFAWLLLGLDSY